MDTISYTVIEEKSPWTMIAVSLAVIFVIIISIGTIYFIYQKEPEVVQEILFKMDRFGLIEKSPEEIQRVYDINQLSISFEEKQILINKTIFLGATPRMVLLALGEPKKGYKTNGEMGNESIKLEYHLPKDSRPTVLVFDEGKLSHAYKGSTIEFDTTPIPYTGTNSE